MDQIIKEQIVIIISFVVIVFTGMALVNYCAPDALWLIRDVLGLDVGVECL